MKVAPVSADLLIKLALAAVAIGAAVYGVRKVSAFASDLAGAPGRMLEGVGQALSDAAAAAAASTRQGMDNVGLYMDAPRAVADMYAGRPAPAPTEPAPYREPYTEPAPGAFWNLSDIAGA